MKLIYVNTKGAFFCAIKSILTKLDQVLANQAEKAKEKVRDEQLEKLEKTVHDMDGRLGKIEKAIQVGLPEMRATVTKFSVEIAQFRKDWRPTTEETTDVALK